MNRELLLSKAFEAMDHAYAPYSNYHVGACVATKDGNYIPVSYTHLDVYKRQVLHRCGGCDHQ